MISKTDRKRYFITAIVLVVILSVVSFLTRGKHPQQVTSIATNSSSPATTVTSSLGTATDPKASEQIQQELIDPAQVQTELNQELGVDQQVIIPTIANSALKITANSRQGVADYLNAVDQQVKSYNHDTEDITKNLFASSTKASDLDDVLTRTNVLVSSLYNLPVPKDAVAFHKAAINTYGAYSKLIELAKQYNLRIQDENIWKNVYYNYSIISQEAAVMQSQTDQLKQAYSLQ